MSASRRQLCTVVSAETFNRLDEAAQRLSLARGRRVTKEEIVGAALRYHLGLLENTPQQHGGTRDTRP
jgi:hypothetical protein